MTATYRWYTIGRRRGSSKIEILGWSRNRIAALARPGTINAYHASSREMAARNVLVEVALSSGENILGVTGKRHPLHAFLKHGVPVALVTDDMGVSRSTHTGEFVKAVEEHGLDYLTLKRLVRNSIEHAFADTATRARLESELEAALAAFERRHVAARSKS